ncbi:MAG: hypothetical protein QJR08_04220 [Bacillota bacterium]|nr:hypothetical protein [Bacillota bacterium]
MAWIESHQELRKHPKTIKLAKLLGITTAEALGRLHMLWWWAVDYAPDGDLTRFDPVDIAIGMEWEGDPDQLIQALLECGHGDHAGFLERTADGRLLIHDWDDYAGRLIERRAKNAERMRHKRAAHVDQAEDDTGGDRAQDVHGTCAARVRLPNLTKPNLTRPEDLTPPESSPPRGDEEPTAQSDDPGPSPAEIMRLWNEIAGSDLPHVQAMTDQRRKHIRARLAASEERRSLDWWRAYFLRIRASPWCRGKNPRDWLATFDWAIRSEDVVTKVLEGVYDERKGGVKHGDGRVAPGDPSARAGVAEPPRRRTAEDYRSGRLGALVLGRVPVAGRTAAN